MTARTGRPVHLMTASVAAPARVTCWGELPAEHRLPGVLRVLVDGQHAGAVEYRGGAWAAHWHTARYGRSIRSDKFTEHTTAEDAVRAVICSGWARRLGARAVSRTYWSDRARRAAGKAAGR